MPAHPLQCTVGDTVQMKKKHPCGNDLFLVMRLGADAKLKCRQCARIVEISREEFNKRAKKKVEEAQ